MSKRDKKMSDQEQAINDYLQALLHEVPEQPPVEHEMPEQRIVAPVVESSSYLRATPAPNMPVEMPAEIAPPASELQTQVAEVHPIMPDLVVEITEEPEADIELQTATEMVTETEPQAPESVVPEWAAEGFQCLLFQVSGLTLAVPLVKLNSVVPWSDNINVTPNQTEWYLGLINSQGKNVKVIDTALMVMPENRRDKIVAEANERFSHILLVDDSRWGLACDSIGDVIWLTADKIKWRQSKNQRPWLAGTALEQLCAVMDTEVFADMLNRKTSA